MDLHIELKSRRKGLINIKNKDKKSFNFLEINSGTPKFRLITNFLTNFLEFVTITQSQNHIPNFIFNNIIYQKNIPNKET